MYSIFIQYKSRTCGDSHQYPQPHICFCADKAHLRELVKLKIAGNIRGDRCKSY